MYNFEKSLKENKPRQNRRNQSFSSTLLDEIYRSIDIGDENFNVEKDRFSKKNTSVKPKISTSSIEDEEMASFKRACLIEKWMQNKIDQKVLHQRNKEPENIDFFSSSSSPSDSSSGVFSTSSETSRKSLKLTETDGVLKGLGRHRGNKVSSSLGVFSSYKNETETFNVTRKTSCFASKRLKPIKTDVGNNASGQTDVEERLSKSKARALQLYAKMKRMKQPISPGGKLTSFLNSIFAKKMKDSDSNSNENHENALNSTCSSASSYSRSCLSKSSRKNNNGVKRTVRFIVDEDQPRMSQNQVKNIGCDEYDYESDSSSDLFELDHLALFRDERFCEELPVYETTHLDKNRAIASGLIR